MTLAEKIAKASIQVGSFAADKTNKEYAYNYISADQVLARVGNALAQVGVILVPAVLEEDTVRLEYTDSYGKSKARYDARVLFSMSLTDGEQTSEVMWVGRGSDYTVPDKALYKAITSGHKYFLMKLLNIGVGNEDSEHEEEPVKREVKKPAEAKPAPANVEPVKQYSMMTVEMAKTEKNSDGIPYSDIDTKTLKLMLGSMERVLEAGKDRNGPLTPEHIEELKRKSDAAGVILKSRE